MLCAVCVWTVPKRKKWRKAVTICNGTAVCEGHLHLTTADDTVLIARRFELEGIDPYQPEEK